MDHKDRAELHLTYNQMQTFYVQSGDHYFKRTQVLMMVIQSALFLALTKVLTATDNGHMWLVLPISILGILASYAWTEMIGRHQQRLELHRYYMRYIESKLKGLGLPESFCTYHKKVFYDHGNYSMLELKLGDECLPKIIKDGIKGPVYRVELWVTHAMYVVWGTTAIVYLVKEASMGNLIGELTSNTTIASIISGGILALISLAIILGICALAFLILKQFIKICKIWPWWHKKT